MRKIIGGTMVGGVLAAIFGVTVAAAGLWVALGIWASAIAVTGILFTGIKLFIEGVRDGRSESHGGTHDR